MLACGATTPALPIAKLENCAGIFSHDGAVRCHLQPGNPASQLRLKALMYETVADGTLTGYYVNDLTRSQSQGGITNTYNLDAALRQRERVTTGGSEAGIEIYHYAGGSDSPVWVSEGGSKWSRSIAALGGSLGAIQTSSGEVTLQLADMHGDTIATIEDKAEAKGLLDSQRFDELVVR